MVEIWYILWFILKTAVVKNVINISRKMSLSFRFAIDILNHRTWAEPTKSIIIHSFKLSFYTKLLLWLLFLIYPMQKKIVMCCAAAFGLLFLFPYRVDTSFGQNCFSHTISLSSNIFWPENVEGSPSPSWCCWCSDDLLFCIVAATKHSVTLIIIFVWILLTYVINWYECFTAIYGSA